LTGGVAARSSLDECIMLSYRKQGRWMPAPAARWHRLIALQGTWIADLRQASWTKPITVEVN